MFFLFSGEGPTDLGTGEGASELENMLDDEVVAVFFRDADGTASADRGQWAAKFQSMLNGFEEEGFRRGVPMVPKPKSEAWILCALKYRYQNCDSLEERSGNDRSPNSLKDELDAHAGQRLSGVDLVAMVEKREVDINRIAMPSFAAFRIRLEEVI